MRFWLQMFSAGKTECAATGASWSAKMKRIMKAQSLLFEDSVVVFGKTIADIGSN